MTQTFTSLIYKDEKYYVAEAIELGVVSQGKTTQEAEKNLKEAVELYLEDEDVAIKQLTEKPRIKTLAIAR